jgi:hypothetical protein
MAIFITIGEADAISVIPTIVLTIFINQPVTSVATPGVVPVNSSSHSVSVSDSIPNVPADTQVPETSENEGLSVPSVSA